MARWHLGLLALLGGCPSPIHQDFDRARDEALRTAGELVSSWEPDVRLTLRQSAVSDALGAYRTTQDPLKTEFDLGVAQLRPRLRIEHLALAPESPPCSPCLRLVGELQGNMKVSTPLGETRLPLAATFTLDLSLELKEGSSGESTLMAHAEEVQNNNKAGVYSERFGVHRISITGSK